MLLLCTLVILLVPNAKSEKTDETAIAKLRNGSDGPLLFDMKTKYSPSESDPRSLYWFDDDVHYDVKLLQDPNLKPLKRRHRNPEPVLIEYKNTAEDEQLQREKERYWINRRLSSEDSEKINPI